jgi:putative heme-binding domain-containing protein
MNPSDWKVMLDKLPGKANPVTGQRLFFHPRLARCSSCHQMEGRGRRVGPDLTTIHRQAGVDATWLLTHILKPNETIAPQYLPWQVTTKDGSAKLGFVLRKGGTQEVYTGIDGNEFAIPKTQIARSEELPISLMPPGLLAPLQPSEIRDLIAYLLKSSE